MKFGVITLFPEMLESFLDAGVVGRAVARKLISVQTYNPRVFTDDVHRTVDDRPFGGGPGMVMKAAPLVRSIAAARQELPGAKVVYLSPQGRLFDQVKAQEWRRSKSLVLLAGRYEGIDERVVESSVDEEVSLGDYVLSGGEVAAMAIIDVVSRLVPGVLGHPQSAAEDSFGESALLDCPHYTRPECFAGVGVPDVLLSGNHAAIAKWRRQQSLQRTRERRPDLLDKAELSASDRDFLQYVEQTQRV